MQTIEYTGVIEDKQSWGDGPWLCEPDKVQWQDPVTGLPCMIKRNRFGVWCGYVGVTEEHPSFGLDYDLVDVDVHGGLTYVDFCQPHKVGEEGHAICHVVEDGENDRVWWLGFDCGHACDYLPATSVLVRFPSHGDETYRDQAFVTNEVQNLARQLKEIDDHRT